MPEASYQVMVDMEPDAIVVSIYSTVHLNAADAFAAVELIQSALSIERFQLQTQVGEGKSKRVEYSIRGVEQAFSEQERGGTGFRGTSVDFVSQDKKVIGSVYSAQIAPRYLEKCAKKNGYIPLNRITLHINDESTDSYPKEALELLTCRVSDSVNAVVASVVSMYARKDYPCTKGGYLGIAGGLDKLYWMNFFGHELASVIPLRNLEGVFKIVSTSNGYLVAFEGDEHSLTEKKDVFMKCLGMEYFRVLEDKGKSKPAVQSLFRFLVEHLKDQKNKPVETIVFQLDFSKMINAAL
jgi:hypothetical protein